MDTLHPTTSPAPRPGSALAAVDVSLTLARLRAHLAAALEASGLGAFSVDPETLEGDWDPRAAEILGAASWRGSLVDHAAAEERESLRRAFAALSAPRAASSLRLEFRLRAGGPRPRWCSLTGALAPREGGGGPAVVGTLQDVTEARHDREQRERLERDLHEANARLARSQARLDAMIEHAPIGIASFGPDLRYERVNDRLAALNGVPAAEHVGRSPRELLAGVPLDAWESAARRVLETGEPQTLELAGRTPATGEEVHHWREALFRVASGDETFGLGILVEDVTDAKRREELERLLVGVVGHDLRNPLSTFMNGAHLLRAEHGLSERGRRTLDRMHAAAGAMDRLISDLLDYTRVRAGQLVPLSPVPIRLGEVVTAVVEGAQLAHAGLRIACSSSGDDAGVWDPDRLRQVVGNLVTNAQKHGAPGEPVRVRWRGEGDEVVLEVANRGPAIPPELLRHVFEPMTQGVPGRREGVGLGLFITSEVVRAHRGTVTARSSAEGETVFEVRLPRRSPAR